MLFKYAAVVSALALLAHAQTTPTVSPAQTTKAIHDLASYISSLTTLPGYTAAVQAFSTGIPDSAWSQMENNPSAFYQSMATQTAEPSWFSALPTSAVAFFSSVAAAEISIVSKDVQGPAPTHAAKVAGVVLAAGGVALAIL